MIKSITKKTNNKKGFTLIELIVVIAILGILAAIAIPRFSGFRDNANKQAALAEAKTIYSSLVILKAEGEVADIATIDETSTQLLALTGPLSGTSLTVTVEDSFVYVMDEYTVTYTAGAPTTAVTP